MEKDIVQKHLAEGRTSRSLAEEHGVSKASISNLVKEYREECQENNVGEKDNDLMRDNLRLRKELAEFQSETDLPHT